MIAHGMSSLSQFQLISIWSELEQAYYGDNGFGSDTAEIYAYRLMAHSPLLNREGWTSDARAQVEHEAEIGARTALVEVCNVFKGERNVIVTIDGEDTKAWLLKAHFDHRAHVKVTRRE